jgi:hypothetical protein
MAAYCLDEFYNVLKNAPLYPLGPELYGVLDNLNAQIAPLFVEKNERKGEPSGRKRRQPQSSKANDNWEEIRTTFKPTTVVEEKQEGIDKWLQNIRVALNKMSAKNYETQRDQIFECLDKCLTWEEQDDAQKKENLKTIALSLFTIASTNKFYAEIYARLYSELVEKHDIFKDTLLAHVVNYTNGIKELAYTSPEEDYEKYCLYNKENDARKATAVFLVHLMKIKTLPVLRVLNIMVAFETLVMDYVEKDGKTNEVDELTEILFLLLQEGKDVYNECKAEWIWKFVIKPNVETLSKCSKKDKKSLSTRAIFKYRDMAALVAEA